MITALLFIWTTVAAVGIAAIVVSILLRRERRLAALHPAV
jgi:hypothetical protein